MAPMSVSDDCALVLEKRPGACIALGNGEESYSLHQAKYDFNDAPSCGPRAVGCGPGAGLSELRRAAR